MAITYIENTGTYDSASTTSAVVSAGGCNAGDLLFAHVCSTSSYPNSEPAGFTKIGENVPEVFGYYTQLYYRVATGGDGDHTWGWASNRKVRIVISRWTTSYDTSSPIDTSSNTLYVTSDTTVRAASMTVAANNSSLFFFGMRAATSAVTFTKPSDIGADAWTENYDAGSTTSDFWLTACSLLKTSSGATGNMDATMSASANTQKHAFAVSIKPLSSGTSSPKPTLLTLNVG